MSEPRALRVGTRRSTLARAQTGLVRRLVEERLGLATEEVLVTSLGDVDRTRPLHAAVRQGVGLFTAALEDALRARDIDLAVHSLKDLPVAVPDDLPVVAVPPREDPRDVLVVAEAWLDLAREPLPLRPGARVGTSSPRRQAQLLSLDPEAVATDIRGNVDTRLGLIAAGVVDAVVLARAGVERSRIPVPDGCRAVPLALDRWPTCPGQGALALQMRADDPRLAAVAGLDDAGTRAAADAERALLKSLGGGCGLPLGATFRLGAGGWRVDATYAPDGWRAEREPDLRRASLAGSATDELVPRAREALTAPLPPRPIPAPAAPRRGPLAGARVLFTFDEERGAPYVAAVRESGGDAAAWPFTSHEPLPLAPVPKAVLDAWPRAQWVLLASPRAVRAAAFLQTLPAAEAQPSPAETLWAAKETKAARFGAVGPATARAMRAADVPVHVVSPDGTARGLADAVARWTPPEGPVVVPCAEEPLPDLTDGLLAAGFDVVPWPVYRTRPLDPVPAPPLPLPVDALVVTSPSAAHALPLGRRRIEEVAARVVAFGPSTAAALGERGIPVHATIGRRTPDGVMEVLTG